MTKERRKGQKRHARKHRKKRDGERMNKEKEKHQKIGIERRRGEKRKRL